MTPSMCSGLTAPPSASQHPLPFGVLVECLGGPWDGDLFWTRGNRRLVTNDGAYALVRMRRGLGVQWAWLWT